MLPIVTILVAGVWAGLCWRESRQILSVNAARVFGMAFGGPAIPADDESPFDEHLDDIPEPQPSGPIRSPLFPGLQLAPPSPEASRAMRRHQEQIAFTEVVVLVWKRSMYGVAGLLGLVGLIGVLTRQVRGPHLFASVVMPAAMVATLVGMRLLQSPEGGGLPPLSIWSHVIVGVGMSAYPVVLIVLLWRRVKPPREAVPAGERG